MKITFAALAVATLLGACSTMNTGTCVQPDPVQPASKCWNQGVNCAEGITPVNK